MLLLSFSCIILISITDIYKSLPLLQKWNPNLKFWLSARNLIMLLWHIWSAGELWLTVVEGECEMCCWSDARVKLKLLLFIISHLLFSTYFMFGGQTLILSLVFVHFLFIFFKSWPLFIWYSHKWFIGRQNYNCRKREKWYEQYFRFLCYFFWENAPS